MPSTQREGRLGKAHRHLQKREALVEIDDEVDLDARLALVEADGPGHARVAQPRVHANPSAEAGRFPPPARCRRRASPRPPRPSGRYERSRCPCCRVEDAARCRRGREGSRPETRSGKCRPRRARSRDGRSKAVCFEAVIALRAGLFLGGGSLRTWNWRAPSAGDLRRKQDSWNELVCFRLDLLKPHGLSALVRRASGRASRRSRDRAPPPQIRETARSCVLIATIWCSFTRGRDAIGPTPRHLEQHLFGGNSRASLHGAHRAPGGRYRGSRQDVVELGEQQIVPGTIDPGQRSRAAPPRRREGDVPRARPGRAGARHGAARS